MQYSLKWLLIAFSAALASCQDVNSTRNKAPASVTNDTVATTAAITKLSDAEMKILNRTSQAVLSARVTQKKRLLASTESSREQLDKLQHTVATLEQQLLTERRNGYLITKPQSDDAMATLTVKPTTNSFRYQAATQQFVAQPAISGAPKTAAVSAKSPLNTQASTLARQTRSRSNKAEAFDNAQHALAAIKRSLNEQARLNRPTLLARAQTLLGVTTPDIRPDNQAITRLLTMVDETALVVAQIEIEATDSLLKIRRLKQRLRLRTPSSALAATEPTVVSIKAHRRP